MVKTKNDKRLALVILSLSLIAILYLAPKLKDVELTAFNDTLPRDGTPLLILQNKVGDDAVPHIHQTWCQLLPYKRYIGDEQVFCYVEVIDDWTIER